MMLKTAWSSPNDIQSARNNNAKPEIAGLFALRRQT
jgi:hypothetical protein